MSIKINPSLFIDEATAEVLFHSFLTASGSKQSECVFSHSVQVEI